MALTLNTIFAVSAYNSISEHCESFCGYDCNGFTMSRNGGHFYGKIMFVVKKEPSQTSNILPLCSFTVSGTNDDCTCNKAAYNAAPIHYFPSSGEDAGNVEARAVHEFTHAYQKSRGGPQPEWTMEGGAVFNECLFQQRMDPAVGFQQCMLTGGGGGGVIKRTRELYLSDPGVKWFSIYSTDRCCESDCPPNLPSKPSPSAERAYYYDVGAFATAFLLHRSGQKPEEFWTQPTGYWQYPGMVWPGVDTTTGWAFDCPEVRTKKVCPRGGRGLLFRASLRHPTPLPR